MLSGLSNRMRRLDDAVLPARGLRWLYRRLWPIYGIAGIILMMMFFVALARGWPSPWVLFGMSVAVSLVSLDGRRLLGRERRQSR